MVLVLLALIGFPVGFAIWVDTSLRRVPVLTDYEGRPAAGSGTTWLFVGSDSRNNLTPAQRSEYTTGDENRNGLTDTIMVIHVPGLFSDTPPTVVSIPRDSIVEIPAHGTDKINAAFSQGGGELLVRTVEGKTGIRIDHYVEIGFVGVADVVEAVGGVPICLTQDVDEDQYVPIHLRAGCQTLDGRTALAYVRTRYAFPSADLQRVKNQREFLSALLRRAASPSVWLNPYRWFSVSSAITGALTVDEGAHVWDLVSLGWALHGSPTMLTVPATGSGGGLEWDDTDATRLFTAIINDDPVPPELLDQRP
ncbi:MAG: hypothetical protein QOH57_1137 [Mycobacterium sp.]|nr:hypothetical protein [Mycobacterium sp.]